MKKGGWCNIWTWGSLWRRLWHLGGFSLMFWAQDELRTVDDVGGRVFLKKSWIRSCLCVWSDLMGETFFFRWFLLLMIVSIIWRPWSPPENHTKKKLRALSSRQTCGFQKAREIQHLEWFGNSQLVQDFRHEQSGNKKKARGVYIHQDYWQLLVIIVLLFSACAFQSHLCHYVPDALPPLKLYIAPQNWWLEGNPFVVLFWFTNAAPSLDLFPATSTTVEAM